MVGLKEFREYSIWALRKGEWATAELALNGLLMEMQKVPNDYVGQWCHGVVRLFRNADFARLADVVEYEFPVKLIEAAKPAQDSSQTAHNE